MKELQILGFNSVDNDAKAASLQLTDKNGIQNVNILIGDHEMGMLGLALNGAKTQRPTTYDLFKSLCESAGYAIKAVLIYNLKNGIFFSKLLIKDADGKNLEFESRVSDGITIATLFKVPILIEDQLFNSISYSNETFLTNSYSGDIYDNKDIFFAGKLKEMSDHQLNNLLRGAIEVEDYELAAQIQKEITERRFV